MPMTGHDVCSGDDHCACPRCAAMHTRYEVVTGTWRCGCGEAWGPAVAQCLCGAWKPMDRVTFPHVSYEHMVASDFARDVEMHWHVAEVEPASLGEALCALEEAGARHVEVEADHGGGSATVRWYGPTPALAG